MLAGKTDQQDAVDAELLQRRGLADALRQDGQLDVAGAELLRCRVLTQIRHVVVAAFDVAAFSCNALLNRAERVGALRTMAMTI